MKDHEEVIAKLMDKHRVWDFLIEVSEATRLPRHEAVNAVTVLLRKWYDPKHPNNVVGRQVLNDIEKELRRTKR